MRAPTLYGQQLEALDAIWREFAGGKNRLLVQMPTGTGKTVMFSALPGHPPVLEWLKRWGRRDGRMMVIAHREELLEQAAAKLHTANPHLSIHIEQADRVASPHADVVVASIQTLAASKFKRLRRLLEPGPFRLVIVDEAHHAAANTYRGALALMGFLPIVKDENGEDDGAPAYEELADLEKALEAWDRTAPKDRLLVGVTATPNRSDAIGLGCVFQTIAYSYRLRQAIEDNRLVAIKPWVIETEESLDGVRMNRGEFNQRELADTVNTPGRNKLAVAAWQDYAEDRQTLAFSVDVAHAHALAQAFVDAGVPAQALSGETPREDRRQMLEAYTHRRVRMIVNCMVLTEGTDLPITGCILHAKPTKSATLYEQMTGRGLRLFEGKRDCIVIDMVDVARRHSLQTAAALYGLPPGLKAQGETLDQLEELFEELQEKGVRMGEMERLTLADLRARASTFDVWSIPDMGEYGAGLMMRWIRLDEEKFRVQYPVEDGQEIITVARDILGRFEVSLAKHEQVGDASNKQWLQHAPRQMAAGVANASAALHLAEAFVAQKRAAALRLKSDAAPWRRGKPTEKALRYLERLVGKRAWLDLKGKAATMTAGEVSDMIDLAKARRS